jgi:LSD1 subclass zinc finger protein
VSSDDLIPCPTCETQLRVPPGAAMIRCPKCQAVLAVEASDEPAPPPDPPAKPFVPPLPFGRGAAKAAPPPPPPAPAKKTKVSAAAPVRARLAPVQQDELAAPRPGETSEEAIQRQRMRLALEKMERQEEKEKDRFLEANEWAKWGRVGLYLLAGGALANVAAAVVFSLFLVSLVVWTGFTPLLSLAAVGLVAHFAATVGGFGCCAAGPPGARGAAIAGAACTVLQLVLAVVAASVLTRNVDMNALHQRSGDPEAFLRSGLLMSGVFNNLLTMAALPLFLVMAMTSVGTAFPLKVLAIPIVAGVAEFAKLSLIGVVGNRLAVEAKGGELSHQAMRFVHRSFAAVLTAAILMPLSVPLSFVLSDAMGLGKGGGVVAILVLPVGAIQNGYYLWWAFTWFAQYQTLRDIAEVVVPTRLTHKGENLDVA